MSRVRTTGRSYVRPKQHCSSPQRYAVEELHWWLVFIKQSADHPFRVSFWSHPTPLYCRVFSDASGDLGFGLLVGDQVFKACGSPRRLCLSPQGTRSSSRSSWPFSRRITVIQCHFIKAMLSLVLTSICRAICYGRMATLNGICVQLTITPHSKTPSESSSF